MIFCWQYSLLFSVHWCTAARFHCQVIDNVCVPVCVCASMRTVWRNSSSITTQTCWCIWLVHITNATSCVSVSRHYWRLAMCLRQTLSFSTTLHLCSRNWQHLYSKTKRTTWKPFSRLSRDCSSLRGRRYVWSWITGLLDCHICYRQLGPRG